MAIISGDKQEIVTTLCKKLHLKQGYGLLFPEQKAEFIQKLKAENKIVCMVGDGLNDALALKQAHVGIALGALGIEAARS
jgi:P-type E1-E2 ATPase